MDASNFEINNLYIEINSKVIIDLHTNYIF